MHSTKYKSNRLEVEHLDDLIRIKTYRSLGCEINLDSVYSPCISNRDRWGKFHGTWNNFLCWIEFYCTIRLINNIKSTQFFNCHCKYYYAYYKQLLQYHAVVRSCKNFLLRAVAGKHSRKKELEGMMPLIQSPRFSPPSGTVISAAINKSQQIRGGNLGQASSIHWLASPDPW
jgi:hypothetical protein